MPINYSRFSKTVAYVAIVSAIINAALAYIGKMLSMPPDTFGPYMYTSVAGLTIGGVIAAAIVYIIIRKMTPDVAKANKRFLVISIIALIVSFYPDIMLPYSPEPDDIGWTYGIIANLMLMHVVAAAFVMRLFVKQGKS